MSDRNQWLRKLAWRLIRAVAGAVCLASLWGSLGALGWPFEPASHFPVQFFWLLAVCSVSFLWARRFRTGLLCGLLALGHLLQFAPIYLDGPDVHSSGETIRLLSANVYLRNENHPTVLDLIRRTDPHLILLIEVDARWVDALEELKADYPYHCIVPDGGSGMALYSRLPLEDAHVESLGRRGDNSIVAAFVVAGRPVTLVGFHPLSPQTGRHIVVRDRQFDALQERLRSVDGDRLAVLLGDFNVSPWSPVFRELKEATGLKDTRQGFGVHSTWPASLPATLRIPIDHCLVSQEIRVTKREIGPDIGSDHRPVIVELTVPPADSSRLDDSTRYGKTGK